MKKVLIISYFFPPCHLTGANRVGSWVKYLPENNVYPIIITRNWEGNEIEERDRLKNSGSSLRHVVNEKSEYYFLPYRSSARDKAFMRSHKSVFFRVLSKVLTFFTLIFQNLSTFFIPTRNIYKHARKLLRENKDLRILIISANPFEHFFFGYLLKKEFKDLEWIADYRDDWTTNPLYNTTVRAKIFNRYNAYFEKKWVATASSLFTVTELYLNRLTEFHSKQGVLIMNGYNEKLTSIPAKEKSDVFQITYSGTIYPQQNFSSLISVIQKIALVEKKRMFRLSFLGAKEFINREQKSTLEIETSSNLVIEVTERIPWEESIAVTKASDVLIMSSYGNLKGVIPSKIFEYMAMDIPVVCYPSDNDIIHEILEISETAIICNTEQEVYNGLKKIVDGNFDYKPNKKEIIKFSAKQQVCNLAEILKK